MWSHGGGLRSRGRTAMRISFDLDEVLFVDPNRYAIEKPPGGLAGILFKEKLRKGTVELIHEL